NSRGGPALSAVVPHADSFCLKFVGQHARSSARALVEKNYRSAFRRDSNEARSVSPALERQPQGTARGKKFYTIAKTPLESVSFHRKFLSSRRSMTPRFFIAPAVRTRFAILTLSLLSFAIVITSGKPLESATAHAQSGATYSLTRVPEDPHQYSLVI